MSIKDIRINIDPIFPWPLADLVADYARPTEEEAMIILARRRPLYSCNPRPWDEATVTLNPHQPHDTDSPIVHILVHKEDDQGTKWSRFEFHPADILRISDSPPQRCVNAQHLRKFLGINATAVIVAAINKDIQEIVAADKGIRHPPPWPEN
jgi:hypothetical protein